MRHEIFSPSFSELSRAITEAIYRHYQYQRENLHSDWFIEKPELWRTTSTRAYLTCSRCKIMIFQPEDIIEAEKRKLNLRFVLFRWKMDILSVNHWKILGYHFWNKELNQIAPRIVVLLRILCFWIKFQFMVIHITIMFN